MHEADRVRAALEAVEDRIARALRRSGRGGEVRIVGITKGHPPETVRAARAAGLLHCGENRVDELEAKVASLGRDFVAWHFVGHLQRNKVRRVLPLFDLIHSIDSLRLAEELSAVAVRGGAEVRGLLQVNTSGEATKGGVAEAEAIVTAERIAALPGLRLQGVMTMAPLDADTAELRRTFRGARRIFEVCAAGVEGFEALHLSMGMSQDFEIAVEEGSTMVRLGTILFGERNA